MRRSPLLPLILGLSLCGCSDAVDPSADGILAVSTSTSGDDPDPDGFQVTIDGIDSLALLPSGTAELDLSPGRHTLQLLGVADHCSVVPGTLLEVDITAGRTTPVAFEISCAATGARITTTTAGEEIDRDGYRVAVDAVDRGAISANGTVLIRLDPGSRTIALSGLAANCTLDGPGSRTVIVVATEVVSVEFAVICADPRPLLAFDNSGDIYVAHVDGSNLTQLTSDGSPYSYNREAAWSPDGSRIAFSKLDGYQGTAIYVMNADGTNPTRLTPEGIHSASPSWSPDGSRIAFETRRDSTGYGGVNSWLDTEIYVMNADGTNPVRLTNNLGHHDITPAWSPDGSRIVYVSDTLGESNIYVMNADGTNRVNLTPDGQYAGNPAWSPDGSRIVFSRLYGVLHVMNADGTDLVPLIPAASESRGWSDPDWSLDGLMIAGTRFTDCHQDDYGDYTCHVGIWVVRIADGTMYELPLGGGSEFGPSWRP